MHYNVEFTRNENGTTACVLDLPEVDDLPEIKTTGATLDEARKFISISILTYLRQRRDGGFPVPEQPLYESVEVGKPPSKYLVALVPTDTGFSSYSPELSGIGVAGETIEVTRELIRRGIELHIEWLLEENVLIPPKPHIEIIEVHI